MTSEHRRRYDLDAVRAFAMLSIFFFHWAKIFDPFSYHVKNAETRAAYLELSDHHALCNSIVRPNIIEIDQAVKRTLVEWSSSHSALALLLKHPFAAISASNSGRTAMVAGSPRPHRYKEIHLWPLHLAESLTRIARTRNVHLWRAQSQILKSLLSWKFSLGHPRYDVSATLLRLSEQPFDFTMHYI